MSIASRIEAIEEHIGDVYDTIDLAKDTTGTNKNIVNIPSKLKDAYVDIINNGTDTLYNNFPKVSGSGTDLSLTPTYEAPMKVDLKGNTSQVQLTGKNLFNINSSFRSSGTSDYVSAVSNNGFVFEMPTYRRLDFYIDNQRTLSAGTYTISFDVLENTSTARIDCTFRTSTTNEVTIEIPSRFTGKFSASFNLTTGTTNCIYMYLLTSQPSGVRFVINNIQVEPGSTATPFEQYCGGTPSPNPSYPQDINVVSGNNNVVVCGKNLFDKNNITTGKSYSNTGDIISLSDTFIQESYINVIPNEYYSFSLVNTIQSGNYRIQIVEYDKNKTFIKRNQIGSGRRITVKLSSNTTFVRLGSMTTSIDELQFEKGEERTTYEAYQSQTYPINLPIQNLFDKDNANSLNAYPDGTTNTIKGSNDTRTIYIPCKPNTTYTISKILSSRFSFAYTTDIPDIGVDIRGRVVDFTATQLTLTTDATANYLCAFIYHSSYDTTITLQDILDSIQIEKGSKANTYTPYGTTPIEMCKIGTYEDSFLRNTGKNLFSLDNIENNGTGRTTYTINNDEITITATSGGTYRFIYKTIPVDINETYTIKIGKYSDSSTGGLAQWGVVNSQGQYYDYVKDLKNTQQITFIPTESTITFRCGYLGNSCATNDVLKISQIQLEKCNQATSYEPYGNGEWYLHKEIGKITLDGSENWQIGNTGTSNWYYYFNSSYIPIQNIQTSSYGLCSHYNIANIGNNNTNQGISLLSNGILRVRYGIEDTTTNYKTWLSTHNTIVYYVLATPTYTEITDTTLKGQLEDIYNAKSKNGTTNINQVNNDLPFNLSVSALEKE